MFQKILIANRGEIACRIIKTARTLGIHCVAVYSKADKDSVHVQLADSAYCIGEAPAKDSYLNSDAVIKAALDSGAEAIHPGYGFLSENPEFAKACLKAKLCFIGPSVEAMQAMSSKQLAKQLLSKTQVPLTPGYHGREQDENLLLTEAQKIGFPILIKAANGGGGKGMREVFDKAFFSESLAAAKREAKASFGDDTVILEKLILNPRHIEVQIMADNQAKVVHLFERDCSIQRRHQKIIEEAPPPELPESLAQKLREAACEVARSIHYTGAGTVEFLVENNQNFYFMEMNTRLQVEHPVTELITGLDLVAWQIKIAAKEPLPLCQEEIQAQGHAIECRIYAEDPFHDFIPSIGQIEFLKEPHSEGLRIDTGVRLFSSISQYYDPMIAKLIAWGPTRAEALQRLEQGLERYQIGGLKTNIPFLQAICTQPQFRKGLYNTHFLSTEPLELKKPDSHLALLMTLGFDYLALRSNQQDPLLQDAFSWQMHGQNTWLWSYKIEDLLIEARIRPIDAQSFILELGAEQYRLTASLETDLIRVDTELESFSAWFQNQPEALTLYLAPGPISIKRFSLCHLNLSNSDKSQLTAPMPATVIAVLKQVGDPVKAGDRLLILEAMKMEHTIHAPADGVLAEIFYTVGTQVNEGAELLSLTEATP